MPALERDLILVGGTLTSEVAGHFLEYINANCPGANVTLAEEVEERNVMSAGNVTVDYDWTAVARDKHPSHDFGLVIFWVNPFAKRRRRAILFGGFTSYGAFGGARYATGDFLFERYTSLRTRRMRPSRERAGSALPSRWRFWRWPCFVLIVEVVIEGGEIIDVQERVLHVLNDPKYPLVTPPSSFPGSHISLGTET